MNEGIRQLACVRCGTQVDIKFPLKKGENAYEIVSKCGECKTFYIALVYVDVSKYSRPASPSYYTQTSWRGFQKEPGNMESFDYLPFDKVGEISGAD